MRAFAIDWKTCQTMNVPLCVSGGGYNGNPIPGRVSVPGGAAEVLEDRLKTAKALLK